MSGQEHVAPRRSNSYELFILVLTVMSLTIMGLQFVGALGWLPVKDETLQLLSTYDNLICVVFLLDFAGNMIGTRPRRDYFIGRRGWLDLIGSIPSFGILRFTFLLRLARLSRLARIARLLSGQKKKEIAEDIIRNRGQYAAFITLLAAFVVLTGASILVLQFEAGAPNANITTGGDALWWAVVTITTVGYGDTFPTTALGRLTGVMVMFAGVGIIGALASILASVLVPSPQEQAEAVAAAEAAQDDAAAAAATSRRAAEAADGMPTGAGAAPAGAAPEQGAGAWPAIATALRDELVAVRAEVAASREEVAASRAEIAALRGSLALGEGSSAD